MCFIFFLIWWKFQLDCKKIFFGKLENFENFEKFWVEKKKNKKKGNYKLRLVHLNPGYTYFCRPTQLFNNLKTIESNVSVAEKVEEKIHTVIS